MNNQGFYFADYYAIDENSIYVGILPFTLFVLFFIRNKKGVVNNISLVFTLFIILWIMLGSAIHPSLYKAIQNLPVFSLFRVAQRFRFDLIIPFSLMCGLGLDNVVRLLQEYKLAKPLSILCILVIYVDLTIFSSTNFLSKTLIIKNSESQLSRGDAFIQTEANTPDFEIQRTIQLPDKYLDTYIFMPGSYEYLKIIQNKGVIECYDSITSGVHAVGIEDERYQGEFYLLESVQGVKVENIFWSPNRLIFKITIAEKTMNNTLIINQNYYPGWTVKTNNDVCKRAINYNGLLATKLDFLTDSITLEFNPFLYYSSCK
jgi:hypothetical protein